MFLNSYGTLVGWLSCLECCPIHQKSVGSIPSQGIYLGHGFSPVRAHIGSNQLTFLHILG